MSELADSVRYHMRDTRSPAPAKRPATDGDSRCLKRTKPEEDDNAPPPPFNRTQTSNPDTLIPSREMTQDFDRPLPSIESHPTNADAQGNDPTIEPSQDHGTPTLRVRNGDFGWNSDRGETDAERLLVKEAAVTAAVDVAERLSSKMEVAFAQIPQPISPAEANAYGIEDMKKWMGEAARLREKHRDFTLLVGVAGNTGSGKTSLLNALLGLKDFLPTSQHQASTAVACQISWNHEAYPGQMVRAEIEFQTREEFERELEEYQDALSLRCQLLNKDEEVDEATAEMTEAERREALAEQEALIKTHGSKFSQLFSLDEEDFLLTNGEAMLSAFPAIENLLGLNRRLTDDTADGMSRKIKPYLDSSGYVDVEGQKLAIWSLIKMVHVFMQVDILRGGISLVDLPGLGDSVESRAGVARRFYDSLDVQIAVSPIVRAADEETTTSLVSRHQEISMRMAGKFNRNGFCIVLSKMDDMDPEAFARGCREFRADEEVQAAQEEIKTLRRDIQQLTKEMARLKRKIEKASKNEKVRKGTAKEKPSQIPELCEQQLQCDTHKSQKEVELAYKEGQFAFWCFRARNALSTQRIGDDLLKRYQRLSKVTRGNHEEEDDAVASHPVQFDEVTPDVSVMPVSSRAFWSVERGEKVVGFPNVMYTGVPALRHWLVFEATAASREHHIDGILHTYQRLLLGIQQWSRERTSEGLGAASRKQEIEDRLNEVHEKYRKKLDGLIKGYHEDMIKFDPFPDYVDILTRFRKERVAIIESWPRRNPEDASSKNMSWVTFEAILKRDGGLFKTTYGVTYNWIESLLVPLMELIYDDWDRVFSFELAKIEHPMNLAIRTVWKKYVKEMKDYFFNGACNNQLAMLADESISGIGNIQEELCFRVRDVINDLRDEALGAKDALMDTTHSHMVPIFRKCLEYTGPGHYIKRREYLTERTKNASGRFVNKAWKRMQSKIVQAKANAGVELETIAPFAIDSSARIMSIFLNRTFAHEMLDRNNCLEQQRATLQKDATDLHKEWEHCWKAGGPEGLTDEDRAWAKERVIPQEFPSMEEVTRRVEGVEDDGGSESGSESESEEEDISEEE